MVFYGECLQENERALAKDPNGADQKTSFEIILRSHCDTARSVSMGSNGHLCGTSIWIPSKISIQSAFVIVFTRLMPWILLDF